MRSTIKISVRLWVRINSNLKNLKELRSCLTRSIPLKEVPDGYKGGFILICPRGLSVSCGVGWALGEARKSHLKCSWGQWGPADTLGESISCDLEPNLS